MNDDVISSGMFKQFFKYLRKQNISTVSPLQAQNLIYNKVRESSSRGSRCGSGDK
jgi:hypothetical protein